MKKQFVLSLWILVSFAVFFSSIEEQLIIDDNFRRQINLIFPEGWGFFTKSPRDFHLEVYKLEYNELKLVTIKNQSTNNLIGFSRKIRVVSYEASILASQIEEVDWVDKLEKDFTKDIDKLRPVEIKVNQNFKYMNKGTYIFKLFKITPFAWAKNNQELNNPVKISKVKIL